MEPTVAVATSLMLGVTFISLVAFCCYHDSAKKSLRNQYESEEYHINETSLAQAHDPASYVGFPAPEPDLGAWDHEDPLQRYEEYGPRCSSHNHGHEKPTGDHGPKKNATNHVHPSNHVNTGPPGPHHLRKAPMITRYEPPIPEPSRTFREPSNDQHDDELWYFKLMADPGYLFQEAPPEHLQNGQSPWGPGIDKPLVPMVPRPQRQTQAPDRTFIANNYWI